MRQLYDGNHLGTAELNKDNPTYIHQKGSFVDRARVQSERNLSISCLAITKANSGLVHLEKAIESPYSIRRSCNLQWMVLATAQSSCNKTIHSTLAVIFALEQEKVKDYRTLLT